MKLSFHFIHICSWQHLVKIYKFFGRVGVCITELDYTNNIRFELNNCNLKRSHFKKLHLCYTMSSKTYFTSEFTKYKSGF